MPAPTLEIGKRVTVRWTVPERWEVPHAGAERKLTGQYLGDDGRPDPERALIIGVPEGKTLVLRYVPADSVTKLTVHRRQ